MDVQKFSKYAPALLIASVALAMCGCETDADFRVNRLYVAQKIGKDLSGKGSSDAKEAHTIEEGRKRQLKTVETALIAMFGTPDEPFIVDDADIGVGAVVKPDLLKMAAGSVSTDADGYPRGLYRRHCVHCHGVTGDGAGPTAAFLNPYPRDFRPGIFKFKSTPLGEKPTDEDLHKTLRDGVPGTAMPSFRLLAEDEREALVNYVKYLSLRGETERALIDELVLTYAAADEVDTSKDTLLNFILAGIVSKWARAADSATKVAPPQGNQLRIDSDLHEAHVTLVSAVAEDDAPEHGTAEDSAEEEGIAEHPGGISYADAVDAGRALFNGKANCFTCHGVMALGDGTTDDYDFWTKEFADWKNLQPAEREKKIDEYRALGGLGPRNAIPRNLRQGVFRGGRRPVDLFWRVRNGIEGTPMPESKTLTEEEVWNVIAYVRQLPYETISQPPGNVVENLRQNP